MGLLSFLTGGGAKAASELVDSVAGSVRNVRNTFAKDLPPDEQAKFEMEIHRMEVEIGKAQMEINKVEASHSSLFVAGWRPYLGWTLGIGIGIQCIVRPILTIWGIVIPALPPVIITLMTILLGGTVVSRSAEKFKKVQNNH